MRKSCMLAMIILLALLAGGCGGSEEAALTSEETTSENEESSAGEGVEEVPGRDTNLALYPGSVRVYHEAGEETFLIQYWVPAPVDDVIDFYKNEYPDVYQFEGAYADGEYTIHHDARKDNNEIETFVIEIGEYYRTPETESMVNIQGTVDFLD